MFIINAVCLFCQQLETRQPFTITQSRVSNIGWIQYFMYDVPAVCLKEADNSRNVFLIKLSSQRKIITVSFSSSFLIRYEILDILIYFNQYPGLCGVRQVWPCLNCRLGNGIETSQGRMGSRWRFMVSSLCWEFKWRVALLPSTHAAHVTSCQVWNKHSTLHYREDGFSSLTVPLVCKL